MTSKICVAVCVLVIVAGGCGSKDKEINRIIESPIDYYSHLSPKVDMARYTTWDWLSPLEDEDALDKLQIETGIREAIESAVDLRMKDRDYQRVTTSPDMVINYHVAGKDIDRDYIRQVYDGSYDPKYRKNFDGPGRARENWQEGSLILFAFDAVTGDLLWRCSATAEVTGEAPLDRRVERLDQAIKMMFTSLPGK
jgi:hypothetical protein